MRTNIVIAADYFSTFTHSQALLGNVILQARACFVGFQSGDWELAQRTQTYALRIVLLEKSELNIRS
jgi:hypothetical protein